MGSNLGAYVKNFGARLKIPPLLIIDHDERKTMRVNQSHVPELRAKIEWSKAQYFWRRCGQNLALKLQVLRPPPQKWTTLGQFQGLKFEALRQYCCTVGNRTSTISSPVLCSTPRTSTYAKTRSFGSRKSKLFERWFQSSIVYDCTWYEWLMAGACSVRGLESQIRRIYWYVLWRRSELCLLSQGHDRHYHTLAGITDQYLEIVRGQGFKRSIVISHHFQATTAWTQPLKNRHNQNRFSEKLDTTSKRVPFAITTSDTNTAICGCVRGCARHFGGTSEMLCP